jgi:hypothetical protein
LEIDIVAEDKRKHRAQMTPEEIDSVEVLVHSQPSSSWNFGGSHSEERMRAKGVTREQALETLRVGYLVEVNENKDLCVVFRNDTGKSSVCVVVALRTRWFVTTWRNGKRDLHTTLDTSKYQWNVNMQSVMEAFA